MQLRESAIHLTAISSPATRSNILTLQPASQRGADLPEQFPQSTSYWHLSCSKCSSLMSCPCASSTGFSTSASSGLADNIRALVEGNANRLEPAEVRFVCKIMATELKIENNVTVMCLRESTSRNRDLALSCSTEAFKRGFSTSSST